MVEGPILCTVFVDAGYLHAAMKKAGLSRDFNPRVIAGRALNGATIGPRYVMLDRIFYYDAIDEQAPQEEADKVNEYLRKIELLPEVKVANLGYLRRAAARKPRTQKGVDVQLAVDALEWAFSRRDSAIGLIAGDADFAPLLDAVRRTGAYSVLMAFPQAAFELVAAADTFIELPQPAYEWVLQ